MRRAPKKPGPLAPTPFLPAARGPIGRRGLGRAAASLVLGGAGQRLFGAATIGCGAHAPDARSVPSAASSVPQGSPLTGRVEVWSCFDLPPEPRSRELSGITWDAETGTFWGVQDARAAIVALRPDAELRRWTLGETVALDVDGPLDLEGIVVTKTGFVVVSEIGPRLLELDRHGKLVREHRAPEKFTEALANKSFESLAMDPSHIALYTTSETSLPRDASATTAGGGPRVRIVRVDLTTMQVTEHAYATDEVLVGPGDHGVSDLAAVRLDELLVLERGFMPGEGNTVRIYRVDLTSDAAICTGTEQLDHHAPVLPKHLFVDLAKLDPARASVPRQPQPTALLENYEGMTLGPTLPDGRRSLVLVSDDNGRPTQIARVLVLAIG